MILKGAQRGSAKALALHLLNDDDNDHVEVHSITGFISNDVTGAFKEVQAIAKGTKCTQPFFSVSMNPPLDESVSVETFETAIQEIEDSQNLKDQPRVIIFHEKEGRRHCHVVWSRIDAETMTAKNLSFFKTKLQDISIELFLQNKWQLPRGFMDSEAKNPTNVTLDEWQAAKRLGKNAIDQKKLIQLCWATSDSKESFQAALNERGYILARGDRRSHVIVCHDGEVIAVTRAVGLRVKQVRERLGDESLLPSVDEALTQHATDIRRQFSHMANEAQLMLNKRRAKLDHKYSTMIAHQQAEREKLDKAQADRWRKEREDRAARFRTGFAGLWQSINGQRRQIISKNKKEVDLARKRNRSQRQKLIDEQLKERRVITEMTSNLRREAFGLEDELRGDYQQLITNITDEWSKATNADNKIPHDIEASESKLGKTPILHHDPRQFFIQPPEESGFTFSQLRRNPTLILSHLSQKQAYFKRLDVKRALAKFINDPIDLRKAIDSALVASELVVVSKDNGDTQFTTKNYLKAEGALEVATDRLGQTKIAGVSKSHLNAAIKKRNADMKQQFNGELSQEQHFALKQILEPSRLACVVGLAGSGKSTMLATAKDAWERQGIKVHGAVLSGKAVDGLEKASGIKSRTLASLEASWENGFEPIEKGEVLVVDEAGMVGTRQLQRISEKIETIGAKLVLIGDPDQLQPIEAGTPFRLLIEKHGASCLTEIHRQTSEWQKQASQSLAKGKIEKAVATYDQNGFVQSFEGRDATLIALVKDYMEDRKTLSNDKSCLAFAHRRRDVHALNQAIRSALKDTGGLVHEKLFSTSTGDRAFAPGDRIVFTRNDREIGVKNGMLGTVESIRGGSISVLLDREDKQTQRVTFNPKQYNAFDHGYAVTIHKSQGATVSSSYVLGSRSMDHSLSYVAMTRHREQMRLYVCEEDKPEWALEIKAENALEKRSQKQEPTQEQWPSFDLDL
jgi:ATP-dependent exoDNAse (exonuclease V) alpha subunit/predicted mannosyl-3-phosphoglycerate phosphatase (HAD superfamily)